MLLLGSVLLLMLRSILHSLLHSRLLVNSAGSHHALALPILHFLILLDEIAAVAAACAPAN